LGTPHRGIVEIGKSSQCICLNSYSPNHYFHDRLHPGMNLFEHPKCPNHRILIILSFHIKTPIQISWPESPKIFNFDFPGPNIPLESRRYLYSLLDYDREFFYSRPLPKLLIWRFFNLLESDIIPCKNPWNVWRFLFSTSKRGITVDYAFPIRAPDQLNTRKPRLDPY